MSDKDSCYTTSPLSSKLLQNKTDTVTTAQDDTMSRTSRLASPNASRKHSHSNKDLLPLQGTTRPVPVRRIQSAVVHKSPTVHGKTPNALTPITSHYALNNTLFQAFYKLLEKKHYPTALSIGLQFCRVAIWDIPQHGYYNSPKYHDLKMESAKNALHVSELLSAVLVKCAPSFKENSGGETYVLEKKKEIDVLRNAAKENYSLIVSEGAVHSFSTKKKKKKKRNIASVKSESVQPQIHHGDEGDPGWMKKVLDCGDYNLNICPIFNPLLATVTEEEGSVTDGHNDKLHYEQEDRSSQKSLHARQDKLGSNPTNSAFTSPLELSRSSSAPAHLGKSLTFPKAHRNANEVELREPPPSRIVSEEDDHDRHEPYSVQESNKSQEDIQFESDLERALHLSGLEFQQPLYQDHITSTEYYTPLTPTRSDAIAIQTLSKLYQDDFEEMRKNRSIHVSYLDTYQGRVRDSLNGCTVIAPLLAIHHLCEEEVLRERNRILLQGKNDYSQQPQHLQQSQSQQQHDSSGRHPKAFGIDDDTVRIVIDIQAAIVAPMVRERVGLPRDALIIPSDVHDFLIEENFLRQDQFGGVYGGNILDDEHLSKFIDTLVKFGRRQGVDIDTAEPVESRKVAATFFFHEHVVSLHRVTKQIITSFGDQTYSPQRASKKRFFTRFRKSKKISHGRDDEHNIVMLAEEETWYEIIDSLPGSSMFHGDEDREQYGNECYSHLQCTARIRCNNAKSLHACLRWYACSKFTPEDQKFIDSYQWNDRNMEFDPRVFQAFVWSD